MIIRSDVRHDAKYSENVVACLRSILTDVDAPVEGPLFDPFAGSGTRLPDLGRADISGIEIEPEWATASPYVDQGDALDLRDYPGSIGGKPRTIVTSPCYGNRLADRYLGAKCTFCAGTTLNGCAACDGTGYDLADRKRRFGYAMSLGHPVSVGSAASLQWGEYYREFHQVWLSRIAQILPVGTRRLILNMSDHPRMNQRQYVCQWWIEAAGRHGFALVEAHSVDAMRIGYGANKDSKIESEMVLVFDRVPLPKNEADS